MGKIADTRQIYKEMIKEISKDEISWRDFLDSSSWNFKYDFDDQVLIYAQRPDARACASMEEWNKKLKRWINRNTKPIYVFDKNPYSEYPFRLVFDISDTHNLTNTSYKLWTLKPEYENDVIESLEANFGDISSKESLEQVITLASYNMVVDNIEDYLSDIIKNKQSSMLENMSDDEIRTAVVTTVWASVSYMMLTRSGLKAKERVNLNEFMYIKFFNTQNILTTLGASISDIAEIGIREIAKTIFTLQKSENLKNHTFEKNDKEIYYNNIEKNKGGIENDRNQIREAGRLLYAKSNNGEREDTSREILSNEVQLSKESQKLRIDQTNNGQGIEQTPNRDTRNSVEESERNSGKISETREYNRGIKSKRPDEVGWTNEQLQNDSRGNGSERNNLHLENNQRKFITKEEQKSNKDFLQDEYISAILANAHNLRVTRAEIKQFYKEHQSLQERVDYIKQVFNDAYTEIIVDDIRLGYKTYENVLHLWKDNYLNRTAEVYYKWDIIAEFIDGMIVVNEFNDIHKTLPSYTDQMQILSMIDNEKEQTIFTQEAIDIAILKGTQKKDGKYRIYNQFEQNLSSIDNVKFLKNEYGIGGSSSIYTGTNIGIEFDAKGITLYRGYFEDRKELFLNWNKVEKRISELIKLDRYLNPKEKEKYPKWRERQEQEIQLSENKQENSNKVLEEQVPKYDFHLGDKVYIGADEYEFAGITDNVVTLYDTRFPLMNKQMDKKDFEIKVRESYSNDHLIVKEKIEDTNKIEEIEEIKQDDEKIIAEITIEENKDEIKEKEEIKNTEEIKPKFVRKSNKIQTFDLHPEISQNDRLNYTIINDDLGVGTPREKFANNIEAIKVLLKCEKENRYATKEEQEILAKYVGWGGLQEAFDEKKENWRKEYNILKELLTDEEYATARTSTLTAFYTPPVVIRAMYKALQNMGLKEANILEPSCGIGNFFGMLPKELENCKMYGIEIDSISARIAGQLYQKSTIAPKAYEKVELPDSFFDIAIGNVPFGEFKVLDRRYDKNKFYIHDYFFGKTLDKVRPGGIVAFITSKGTMDKQNSAVRRYIAQRADLIGAIRLPDNTFTKNAGTKVTSDIIFLKKRESMTDIMPEWVNLDTTADGITMNKYFVDNPNMILGKMQMETTRYGIDSVCKALDGMELETLLNNAIENIKGEITEFEYGDIEEKEENFLPADPNVKNFSYTIVDGKVYFRENSIMVEQDLPITTISRIKGMIELRDCVRELIDLQTEDFPEENIKVAQAKLNKIYDNFTKKYGIINSRGNRLAFEEDSSYYLLCSLEVIDSDGKFVRKADMFNKRTIKAYKEITSVDTANEALIVSLSEKADVDLEYMSKLTNKSQEEIINELKGIIYKIPMENNKYVTADEYLSGNIREKLKIVEALVETQPEFQQNIDALKQVMPKDLTPSEIGVKLGATWIPTKIIEDFMFELFDTTNYCQWKMKVNFSEYNSEWYITNKSYDKGNVKANKAYGTDRINAYEILEKSLNLKDVKIFDIETNLNGDKVRVLNPKETAIAQAKQEQIKQAFEEWIWKDPKRREYLVRLYNDKFNSIRPREYEGSHLVFSGMNPEIKLRTHQQNAIAHILYGGNTLLAHEVRSWKNI